MTAAARPLGLRKSTVSRRIAALEERLGVRLLERGRRGVALTDAGRDFHAGAARLVAEARRLEEAATAARATPQGTLRVAAPAVLAELLAPVLAELLLRFPALRVEVALEQHGEPGDACDLALRVGPLADSARVARRLGELRAGVYASAAYLARRGTPRTAAELDAHEVIVLAEPGSEEVWFLGQGHGACAVAVDGRLRVPDLRAGQAAARAGLGLVWLPAALVADDLRIGLLVQVLQAETPPGIPVHAVHAGGRHVPAKVRALLDLLRDRRALLQQDPTP